MSPDQTERFEILQGVVGFRVSDEKLIARPGDVTVVVPGTTHRLWNAGEEEARFLAEIRPALQFESLIETMFTLAAEGKTNRKGPPNPLRLAVMARAHFDTVRLRFPPSALQRAALTVGAPLGKALGYPERVTRRPVHDARPHGRPERKDVRGRPHHTASASARHWQARRDERRR